MIYKIANIFQTKILKIGVWILLETLWKRVILWTYFNVFSKLNLGEIHKTAFFDPRRVVGILDPNDSSVISSLVIDFWA